MSHCDKANLETITRTYWTDTAGLQTRLRYKKYITNIFPQEIACIEADKEAGVKRLPKAKCQQLVFLVGHTLEPLIQAVWAYQPEQVLLILSKDYGPLGSGKVYGKAIKKLLENDLSTVVTPPNVICEILTNSTTEAVFKKLNTCLKATKQPPSTENQPGMDAESEKEVVIDITGSKKNMIAGAFLFAAYSNIPVSYVDFDDESYDSQVGKPFGYACRIGLIKNPYERFALRDWERVRFLYTNYNFRSARELLEKEVKPAMESVFSAEDRKQVDLLLKILVVYELWDNGDFSQAKTLADKIPGFTSPTAVQVLGENAYWPSGDEAQTLLEGLSKIEFGEKGTDSIYLQPEKLLTYAHDEISRAKRLIDLHEDNRSALLKSVSLWEVLSRARVLGLWHTGKLEIARDKPQSFHPKQNAPEEIKAWDEEIYYGIICTSSGGFNEAALKYDPNGNSKVRKRSLKITARRDNENRPLQKCQGGKTKEFYLRRASNAPLLDNTVSMGANESLRHKAIHTYLSVPKPVANDAQAKAEFNLADYGKNWGPEIFKEFKAPQVNTTRMKWSELCQLCGLDFLLTHLQQDLDIKEDMA